MRASLIPRDASARFRTSGGLFFASLVGSLLGACATSPAGAPGSAGTPGGGKADDPNGIPTLSFNADWSVTQSAPLVEGGQMQIHYAPERLPDCRGTSDTGEDTWQIVGHYLLDGVEPAYDDLAVTQLTGNGRLEPPTTEPVDVVMDVPLGTFGGAHDLAIWFVNSDATGCTAYDSDYGQNFHFTLEAAE